MFFYTIKALVSTPKYKPDDLSTHVTTLIPGFSLYTEITRLHEIERKATEGTYNDMLRERQKRMQERCTILSYHHLGSTMQIVAAATLLLFSKHTEASESLSIACKSILFLNTYQLIYTWKEGIKSVYQN